mmetsp:Transcript_21049/g.59541  ORF Transcript_21049/g.59541 Transcript_21049/m.59541 type:complete len:334 (+) Transcript_21049:290-1291(+)
MASSEQRCRASTSFSHSPSSSSSNASTVLACKLLRRMPASQERMAPCFATARCMATAAALPRTSRSQASAGAQATGRGCSASKTRPPGRRSAELARLSLAEQQRAETCTSSAMAAAEDSGHSLRGARPEVHLCPVRTRTALSPNSSTGLPQEPCCLQSSCSTFRSACSTCAQLSSGSSPASSAAQAAAPSSPWCAGAALRWRRQVAVLKMRTVLPSFRGAHHSASLRSSGNTACPSFSRHPGVLSMARFHSAPTRHVSVAGAVRAEDRASRRTAPASPAPTSPSGSRQAAGECTALIRLRRTMEAGALACSATSSVVMCSQSSGATFLAAGRP